MSWMTLYRSRLKSAEEAVRVVESGHKVYMGSGCAAPHGLITALTGRAEELRDVEIIHHLTLGEAPYIAGDMKGHFRLNDCFVGSNTRDAVNEGRADYVPVHLHEMPRLFRRGVIPLDCAMVVVSPPDEHGFCSFGIEVGVTKPAALSARVIVAEVNRKMPRTLGDSFIHVSKIPRHRGRRKDRRSRGRPHRRRFLSTTGVGGDFQCGPGFSGRPQGSGGSHGNVHRSPA
jgi:acetyl-CoA hydrolase